MWLSSLRVAPLALEDNHGWPGQAPGPRLLRRLKEIHMNIDQSNYSGSPSTHVRRSRIVSIRMTVPEYERLRDAAVSRRQSISALARKLVICKVPASIVDLAFAAELGRVGNNLNQIARNTNAGVFPTSDRIHAELRTLRELLLNVQQRLRRDRESDQGK